MCINTQDLWAMQEAAQNQRLSGDGPGCFYVFQLQNSNQFEAGRCCIRLLLPSIFRTDCAMKSSTDSSVQPIQRHGRYLRMGKYTKTSQMHHGREMETGKMDEPKGMCHAIKEEDKVGWQEVEGEREETGEQGTMGGQGYRGTKERQWTEVGVGKQEEADLEQVEPGEGQ
jgi:hypothetical protein